ADAAVGGGPPLRFAARGALPHEIDGAYKLFLVCNIAAVGKDNVFAPRAHVADGSLYMCYVPGNVSRKDMATVLLRSSDGRRIDELPGSYTIVPVHAA